MLIINFSFLYIFLMLFASDQAQHNVTSTKYYHSQSLPWAFWIRPKATKLYTVPNSIIYQDILPHPADDSSQKFSYKSDSHINSQRRWNDDTKPAEATDLWHKPNPSIQNSQWLLMEFMRSRIQMNPLKRTVTERLAGEFIHIL